MRNLLLLAVFLVSGCQTMPDNIRGEWEHVSHPFAGPPFGPVSEEDSLNQLNVICHWEKGRVYTEAGLGWHYADDGFYGPDLTFTGRVGVNLWSKK